MVPLKKGKFAGKLCHDVSCMVAEDESVAVESEGATESFTQL